MGNQEKKIATSNQSLGVVPRKVTGPPVARGGKLYGSFLSGPSPMATGNVLEPIGNTA